MSRFDEIAQEDGWEVGDFPGALESAAADGIAWKLLDLTMDVADREPSKEDIREAMVTGERILAGLLADAAEAEQRAANAEAERDRYAEREEAFSRGLRVADAGRYRADWPGAVETTIRRAERAEAELAALRERVRLIEARTKREATEFVRRAGRARVASDEDRALDEAGDALDDVCAGLRAVADAAPCHCGRPVAYGYDGDPTHHRRMCADCDAVRCDAYPMECPHRADLLDDDTTGAASGEGEK